MSEVRRAYCLFPPLIVLQETVSGVVQVNAPSWAHKGLVVDAHGGIIALPKGKAVGVIAKLDPEGGAAGGGAAGGSSVLLSETIELEPAGKLPAKPVEIPFEFECDGVGGRRLIETYHGVYLSVVYRVTAVLKASGAFSSDLTHSAEFLVQVPARTALEPGPKTVDISPATLANIKKDSVHEIPDFQVLAKLEQTRCSLTRPFTGTLTLAKSEARVRSLELQLVRVESVATASGTQREATEIQNLQVGEGDVPRGVALPLYMVLPRMFTCPSFSSKTLSVQFEVNVIVQFEDYYSVTQNVPVVLFRS